MGKAGEDDPTEKRLGCRCNGGRVRPKRGNCRLVVHQAGGHMLSKT